MWKWINDGTVVERIPILDHGYMELITPYGADEQIVEAARMSTNKGFRTWAPYQECKACGVWKLYGEDVSNCPLQLQKLTEPGKPTIGDISDNRDDHDWKDVPRGDFGLLSYLHANKHSTPFEFAGCVIEVQAPIMVFREWHRHRTQSYNEMSARYTPLPNLNYVPTVERMMMNSKANKQASTVYGSTELTGVEAEYIRNREIVFNDAAEEFYQYKLKVGVPKELARTHIGVSRYSRMRANANLRNWLAFLTLRSTAKNVHAQWEIRQYADALGTVLEKLFPRTWELFCAK